MPKTSKNRCFYAPTEISGVSWPTYSRSIGQDILFATGNRGKLLELQELISIGGKRLLTLADLPEINVPDETGSTFAENAGLKASFYAGRFSLASLADDSGLEVEALGGAPGVRSARYAGPDATDAQNIEKLLFELLAVGPAERNARFVCAMALAAPDGSILFTAEGTCQGSLIDSPRGTNGFGYDPIFVPKGSSKTFGEMTSEEKSIFSHRAQAARTIVRYLLDFTGV